MKTTGKNIGILGCGWLGFPLAIQLLEKGYGVKGTTTSEEKLAKLKAAGIDPFLIMIHPEEVKGNVTVFLEGLDTLIIDFPPGIRVQPATDYIGSMRGLITAIRASSVKKVLFVSSISVYEELESFPIYTEKDMPNAVSERGGALIQAEELLKAEDSFDTTILRLGGLIGPQRHPVNQLSGRQGIKNGEAPVNLIHLEDCLGIILKILKNNSLGETFNAVFPEHPSKEEYYRSVAAQRDLPLPEFSRNAAKGKIIDSRKIERILEYRFTGNIFE